jgi:uncharacterized membrane protein
LSAAPDAAEQALERTERLAALLLRLGVSLSVAAIASGLALGLLRHPEYRSDPSVLARLTAPGAAFPHHLPDVAAELAVGRGRAVVSVGLLLLIATPVLRVAASALSFLLARDWAFGAISLAVLCVLLLSFALGGAG